MFSKNVFTSLRLKSETPAYVQFAITLFHTIYKFFDMVSVGNLHWGYPSNNGVTKWRHGCGHMSFSGTFYNVCNLLVEISAFKRSMKLTNEHNKFGKRTVQNLQTRTHFLKRSRNPADQIIDQLYLSKIIPNVSFKFLCQENCEQWLRENCLPENCPPR